MLRWVIFLWLLLNTTLSVADASKNSAFDKLLDEAGMSLASNNLFKVAQPQANQRLPFEQSLQHPEGLLEVRYVIRPLKNVKIDYEDPHASAPDPNHLFPLLFDSVANRISDDGYRSKSEFPAAEAKKMFNADWAAATAFDVHPEFSSVYKQGILIAMHRNKLADAYVIFLYNDYPKIKTLLKEMQTSLQFNP